MSSKYSPGPDDDAAADYLLAEEVSPAPRPVPAVVTCGQCRRPVAASQPFCTYCGAAVVRTRARPVRPAPLVEDLPFADALDIDDPLDDVDEIPLAPVVRRPRPGRPRAEPVCEPAPPRARMGPLFSGYVVMMAISVSYGLLILMSMLTRGAVSEQEQYWGLFAVEVIDALLILGVAVLMGRIPPHPTPSSHQVGAWVGGFPILATLLAVNIGMVMILRKLVDAPEEQGTGLTVLTVLLVCVQPAIFEEWFFRYLALGALREKFGLHWGVIVSAVMFSLAHIFNPIGMPYLFVLGVVLGYLRVWSGSLALPMILHFIHNAVVLAAAEWL